MSGRERRCLEQTLAGHAAPVLLGIKCAGLISVPLQENGFSAYQQEFEQKSGLRMLLLCRCRERSLLYVCHDALLEMQLNRPEIAAFLRQFGYTADMTLDGKLAHLKSRMQCSGFPHEIGVFLGYPLADVQGFIDHQGKNCLLCGCWKVYSDPESARRTFAKYSRCRELLCGKLAQGCGFFRALELSKEELL